MDSTIDIDTQSVRSKTTSLTDEKHQISLSWSNLVVKGKTKKKGTSSKTILHDVSGYVLPGELVAIMGASGAGKSTLLNTLTFRNLKGLELVSGTIYGNGIPISPDSLTSVSAYVQQDDLFVGSLTVRETLQFAAKLRMDNYISKSERMSRVENVIIELGLSKCADTVIGVPGRVKGISGGEMKRLAFACEVLTNPSLFFCDEPTSGLDSYMAQNVVQVLRNLARQGKTIVCTIHQPSSQVYDMFDKILLMAEGRLAYLGSLNGVKEFFARNDLACPMNFNPADHFVHVLAIPPGLEEESRRKVKAICDDFESSSEGQNIGVVVNDLIYNTSEEKRMEFRKDIKKGISPYKASWFEQFGAVLWRSFAANLRESKYIKVRILQSIFLATFLGILFFDVDYTTQRGVNDLNGAIFLLLTNLTFENVFSVINVFCLELPIFLREHFNGMYRSDVYFLCRQIADAPIFFIVATCFVTIYYWMVGFYPDAGRFFIAWIGMVVMVQTVVSFGYLLSCISKSISIALAIAPTTLVPAMVLGGYYINKQSIPVYLRWVEYVSWYYYGNELLISNQWHGVNITCEASENANDCAFTSGEQVIESLGFEESNIWFDILMLIVLSIGFRIIGYIFLYNKARR